MGVNFRDRWVVLTETGRTHQVPECDQSSTTWIAYFT